VDDERLSGDVPRALRSEEADDVSEFARCAPPPERDLLELLVARAARIELVESRCGDPTGRDTVDGDALRADLPAQRLQPPGEPRTERVREGEVGRRFLGRERRECDDPSGRAALKVRQAEADE